jgi:hypothetical protein
MTTTTQNPALEMHTLADSYEYTVRVSAACMPSKCWGKYLHVAVMRVAKGHVPSAIRHTRDQRVVSRWERQFAGTSSRCAAARAENAAWDMVRDLTAKMHAGRKARQDAAYSEALAARSGEEV